MMKSVGMCEYVNVMSSPDRSLKNKKAAHNRRLFKIYCNTRIIPLRILPYHQIHLRNHRDVYDRRNDLSRPRSFHRYS